MNEYVMSGGGLPYEYIVKQKETRGLRATRILLCIFYSLWTLGNVLLVIFFKSLLPLVIILYPATLWLLVFLTWRRTFVEYEFSFFDGELTVCRILGGKSRKVLAEINLRDLAAVVPYDDAHESAIRNFRPVKRVSAVSSIDAPELYALLWKDQADVHYMLCMEANEKAIKEFRRYNASAMKK